MLDTAAALLPADPWLAGQRIRYLVEAQRTNDALAAAAACRAEQWWCLALAGYAAHVAGKFAVADSVYTSALAQMSDAERCRWLDVAEIIDGDLGTRLRGLPCDARSVAVRRLFWLASPLLSVSTTDLLTEHFARRTRARIAERSASVDGEFWADDERSLMIRYGWPRWFTQSDSPIGSTMRPSITGHDAGMPYYFFPLRHALDSTTRLTRADWNLDDPRAQSGYAPIYARSVRDFSSQVAVFRRGDSARVIATWDVRRDSTLVGRDLTVSLVVAAPAGLVDARGIPGRNFGRVEATAPIDSGIVSVELFAEAERRAGRVRLGVPPRNTGRIALSDLLLHAPSSASQTSLETARDSALLDTVISSGSVGVFWEAYGLAPQGESVKYSVAVEPTATGWVRRAAERFGLADPTRELRIQWEEVPAVVSGIAGRAVRLDLSRLRAGRYRIEVTITGSGGATSASAREIELRPR